MVTEKVEPIEFFISPGGFADDKALQVFNFDLPAGSVVYADYYEFEDAHYLRMAKFTCLRCENKLYQTCTCLC
ncbi:hypothetical protein [Synechococcus sp. PCC 7502]|uniref:hypothetical protein n=1 Tax=Synechococcus sp. PCC 7502 TaxID=1173263 RepID=UPI0003135A6A|nr:hypothetical protein [Synechococcus sp. PCC 7502]